MNLRDGIGELFESLHHAAESSLRFADVGAEMKRVACVVGCKRVLGVYLFADVGEIWRWWECSCMVVVADVYSLVLGHGEVVDSVPEFWWEGEEW